jgi:hypothetical protein
MAADFGWRQGWLGTWWERLHGAVVAITLGIAILLTVYSLGVYIYRHRSLFRGSPAASGDGS